MKEGASKRKVRAGGGDDVILVERASERTSAERGGTLLPRFVSYTFLVCRVCGSAEHGRAMAMSMALALAVALASASTASAERNGVSARPHACEREPVGRGRWSVNFYLTKFFFPPPFRFFPSLHF